MAEPVKDPRDTDHHPRRRTSLIGHADAERRLLRAYQSGRLHHAWLMAGARGIGKATLAYRFASHALSAPGDRDVFGISLAVADESSAARQIRAMSHPGLLVIRRPWDHPRKRHKSEIPVDEVRRLRGFLTHTADAGSWRVVIVDSADELNASAANALLKSLEEPPARTVFLLVSSQPGRLLATIRSRCRTLRLAPLASDDLAKAARQAFDASDQDQPSPQQWPVLLGLSRGSVRRLLSLHATGGIDLHNRIESVLSGLPDIDWRAAHGLSDELAPVAAEQRFELFFSLFQDRLAETIRERATAPPASGDARTQGARHVSPQQLASLAELWETVARDKGSAVALNLDRKSLILETLARLEAVSQRRP